MNKKTYKYRVENLDCASCALNIETALSKRIEVSKLNLDFNTSILETDWADLKSIQEIVNKVEPGIKIREFKEIPAPASSKKRREILRIILVLLLLLAGLFFEDAFHLKQWRFLEYLIFIPAYLISGWGVISKAFKNIYHGRIFDENSLMTIATLGAFIIHYLPEAVTVMLFYNIGEFVQGLAVNRSRKSIKELIEIRPDFANRINGEGIQKVKPEDVKIDDRIIIKPGEKIPLDGEVTEGTSFADTFALTGESVPRSIKKGDNVLSGMINRSGLLTVKVTRLFQDSSIVKIFDLVESAGRRKAQTENFISKFAKYYTPAVVVMAALVAFLPPLLFPAESLNDWIYRALVMLVVSCPCALVISIPLGYFGGIGGASRRGILIKGANFLDSLLNIRTVVFDKTGTLTRGVFKVTEIVPDNGFSKEELITFAAKAEIHSNHPIAESIRSAYGKEIQGNEVSSIEEMSGLGIRSFINGTEILLGNDNLLHREKIEHNICDVKSTVVHIAVNKKYAGYIIISDVIKPESFGIVEELKSLGVKQVVMLTGDNKAAAEEIGAALKIDKVYSELLPEDKLNIMEDLFREKSNDGKIAFIGDGINDAPVIARADVGMAMGGIGSDSAIEAADIVLMEDNPRKAAEAIRIAHKTRNIVWQNIIFAMTVKLFFIVAGTLGVASMWEAVFGDMGVALIAILNSTRMLKTTAL